MEWDSLKKLLIEKIGKENFSTWIEPSKIKMVGNKLVIKVPNSSFAKVIYSRFFDDLVNVCKKEVLIEIDEKISRDILENGENSRNKKAGSRKSRYGYPLNPLYNFSTFVVGEGNQLAHAFAIAVSKNPGKDRRLNPLYIYGGVGLGKTHLIQAIGHEAVSKNLRVIYIPAEEFVNNVVQSIRLNKMDEMRKSFRQETDLLLVDDIQHIAGKEKTQEEFFHIFNALYLTDKQVVFTSQVPPKKISGLTEQLSSRFEGGVMVDVKPPDFETRIAILKKKAEIDGIDLPDEVAIFIASQKTSNVRELEGFLNKVISFSRFFGAPLNIETAKKVIGSHKRDIKGDLSPAEVIKFVARHYGLRVREIKSKSNAKIIAFPRQVAMYLLKKILGMSYVDIGKLFNNKHHSTVMHAVEKIEKLRHEDSEFDRTLDKMIAHLVS